MADGGAIVERALDVLAVNISREDNLLMRDMLTWIMMIWGLELQCIHQRSTDKRYGYAYVWKNTKFHKSIRSLRI